LDKKLTDKGAGKNPPGEAFDAEPGMQYYPAGDNGDIIDNRG